MFEYLLVTVMMTNYTTQSSSVSTTRLSSMEECQYVAQTIKKDLSDVTTSNSNLRGKVSINCIRVNKIKGLK